MTLQMKVQTDGQTDNGYHNIPAFSSKSTEIIIRLIEMNTGQVLH